MTKPSIQTNLYNQVAELLQIARTQVVRTINNTMTHTYFEIGRLIVEDEQGGEAKAEYGKDVLNDLSKKLTSEFGRGFSRRNLDYMRQFYLTYSNLQTVSANLQSSESNDETSTLSIPQKLSAKFNLSWSHYLFLMRIDNENERKFYEIESADNNWSLKELKRQFNSSLYERLALSRDKEGVMKLAQEGLVITRYEDAIKEPLTLEFLGLSEDKSFSESESDLEQSIIDKLEHFLLELGKDKNEAVVRYTLPKDNNQIFATKYQMVLPSKEEFKRVLGEGL
ncbi:MAG: DUF1016 N-terminal domain-containing protein [Bacteroidales bacterium]